MLMGNVLRCLPDHLTSWRHSHQVVGLCYCGSVAVRMLQARVTAEISRRVFLAGATAVLASLTGLGAKQALAAQSREPGRPILLTNLKLFDGVSRNIRQGVNIRIEGNRVTALAGVGESVENTDVIDCAPESHLFPKYRRNLPVNRSHQS